VSWLPPCRPTAALLGNAAALCASTANQLRVHELPMRRHRMNRASGPPDRERDPSSALLPRPAATPTPGSQGLAKKSPQSPGRHVPKSELPLHVSEHW
jgi:hypothetical protein